MTVADLRKAQALTTMTTGSGRGAVTRIFREPSKASSTEPVRAPERLLTEKRQEKRLSGRTYTLVAEGWRLGI